MCVTRLYLKNLKKFFRNYPPCNVKLLLLCRFFFWLKGISRNFIFIFLHFSHIFGVYTVHKESLTLMIRELSRLENDNAAEVEF